MDKILKIVLIVAGVVVIAGGLLLAGTFLGSRLGLRADGSGPVIRQESGGRQQPGGNVPGSAPNGGGNRDGGRGGNAPDKGRFGGVPGQQPGGRDDREQASLTPVTADEAKTAAQTFVTALKIDGLEIGDVTLFGNGAHVVVKETAGGNGAFELVVDPRSKTAHPTGVLWNLKYGGVLHAAAIDNRTANATPAPTSAAPAATPADVPAEMSLSAEQAIAAAQAFLDKTVPGATAATSAVSFYGYYSVAYSQDGQVAGILSVNGANGDVLFSGPHGMPGRR